MDLTQKLIDYRLLPVVTPDTPENTVQLARALFAGGVKAIEVTLRTESALEALVAVKQANTGIAVGVGTIINPGQLERVAEIGVEFAVSPGLTPRVLDAARDLQVSLLPGVSSPSELMLGLEYGIDLFKLFPAAALNGETMLKALYGPFPQIHFCPTGGVNPGNALNYLGMANVVCVGGSWMLPDADIKAGNWSKITELSAAAMALVSNT